MIADLNESALEKAKDAYYNEGLMEDAIRAYLAALPPVSQKTNDPSGLDAEPVANDLVERLLRDECSSPAFFGSNVPLKSLRHEAAAAIQSLQQDKERRILAGKVTVKNLGDTIVRAEAAEAGLEHWKGIVREAFIRADTAEAENARLRNLDTCMCGSPMDAHDMGSGHSPVSMYDYERQQLMDENARLKARLIEAEKVIEPFASFFNKVLEGYTPSYLERRNPEDVVLGWNEGHLHLKDLIRARSFSDGGSE